MSQVNLTGILRGEMERCLGALRGAEPGTEAYGRLLGDIEHIRWMIEPEKTEGDTDAVPAEEPKNSDPVAESAPDAQDGEGETHAEEDGTDWKEYRLALRADLVEARRKGVNTSELIQKFGVGKYGGVPDGKLPELRADMEKALAEKESP